MAKTICKQHKILLRERSTTILSYDKLRDLAKGANQPNLNGEIIKNFPILTPPMELQNRFAALIKSIDKSKFVVKKSLEHLETLKKSLMQKYFG